MATNKRLTGIYFDDDGYHLAWDHLWLKLEKDGSMHDDFSYIVAKRDKDGITWLSATRGAWLFSPDRAPAWLEPLIQ